MSRSARRPALEIADTTVPAGRRRQLELPITRLVSGTPVSVPLIVVHGRTDGPVVGLTAAIHGDELNGVEIIRRVMATVDPRTLAGTVIAAPVVNVLGFNTGDRYLPDRRDLNRSFPGSPRGTTASRIAHLVMTELVARVDVLIDLHTGSGGRTNLPQVRCDLRDEATKDLASIFAAPVTLHSSNRDGSLRQAATSHGVRVLLFEGGEALRFDPWSIGVGTEGVLRVLDSLDMIETIDVDAPPPTAWSDSSRWLRASRSGMLHLDATLGDLVTAGDLVATIYDPFGKRLGRVTARGRGVVIGATQEPVVQRGDAVVHIAAVDEPPDVELLSPPE